MILSLQAKDGGGLLQVTYYGGIAMSITDTIALFMLVLAAIGLGVNLKK